MTRLSPRRMRQLLHVVLIATALASVGRADQQLLSESFEGTQPKLLQLWTTNVAGAQVNAAEVTEECAAGGRRSFKLDLNLPFAGDGYSYWYLPLDMDIAENLRFLAKLKVVSQKTVSVYIGFRYDNPNLGWTDAVWRGRKTGDLPAGWEQWETYDPTFRPSSWPVPLKLRGLAIFIYGDVATNAQVYVDDLELAKAPGPQSHAPRVQPTKIRGEYEIVPVKPFCNEWILPTLPHIPAKSRLNKLEIVAARDEIASASFAVISAVDLRDVRVSIEGLVGPGNSRPPVDLRVVKPWWANAFLQRPENSQEHHAPVLAPHLLVHDDAILQLDPRDFSKTSLRAQNHGVTQYHGIARPNPSLKREYVVNDADALLPVSIQANQPRQFWITLRVPANLSAGVYTGQLRVEPSNAKAQALPVTLRVLPFALPPPSLEYSIFYCGKLTGSETPVLSSSHKTPRQLAAELSNLKDHGIDNPNVYQWDERLAEYLKLRESVRLGKERLFSTHSTSSDDKTLSDLLSVSRAAGFAEVYVYGPDEYAGDNLRAQRGDFQRVHKAGLKVFAAVSRDYYDIAGDLIDAAVVSGKPDSVLAAKLRANGKRIYCYANPHNGRPLPEMYRRNYGIGLWKAGYSGAMPWGYHDGDGIHGHPWNGFESEGSGANMTFPTSSGVIDTVAWEGFREGVNDVRYVTLLENLLKEARNVPSASAEAARTRLWLGRLDPKADLDTLRVQLISRILRLRKLLQT